MDKVDTSGIEKSIRNKYVHVCNCGYATLNKSNYNKHKKRCGTAPTKSATRAPVNNNGFNFVCEKCGLKYRTGYGLSLHVKNKHNQQYKHECSTCGKKFNQTVQYKYHCSRHLKEDMDKYPQCKKESSHDSIGHHLKTCTAPSELYKCDQCPASFAKKYSLSYHKKGKHQPPEYGCDHCGLQFAWRSSLKAHMKCHCYGK